jgi:uncharacterized damage-inducible protein DinB
MRSIGPACLVLALSAQFVATQPAPNPVTDAARAVYPVLRDNILASFATMPEAKYGFKPTPELMTFGELAIHIVSANAYYCRRLGEVNVAEMSRPTPTASKDDLVNYLRHSFDVCTPVIDAAKDADLAQTVAVSKDRTSTRARILLNLISGMDHHYAQAASYLRHTGLVPPTAQGKN